MENATEATNDQATANADAAEQTSSDQQQAASQQPPDWVPKRMGELAAARRAADQRAQQEAERAARLEQELAQLRAGQTGDDGSQVQPQQQDIHRLAMSYADQIVQERLVQQQTSSRIAEVNAAGQKEFGDEYQRSIDNLTMAGVGGPDFLTVITSVPNPEKLVTWLGKQENMGEAMRVASLSPLQMGIEMTKLAGRAAKEMGKQVSKAPAPVDGVGAGGGGDATGSEPKMGTPEWFTWRNKNARKRR